RRLPAGARSGDRGAGAAENGETAAPDGDKEPTHGAPATTAGTPLLLVRSAAPVPALPLRVPDVPGPHEPINRSPEEFAEFIEASGIRRGRLAVPKAVLREQIAQRRARLQALLRPAEIASRDAKTPDKPKPEQGGRMKRGPQLG